MFEILVGAAVMLAWGGAWLGEQPKKVDKEKKQENHYVSNEERALAADAMKTAITGTLTATSILLAACTAVLGFYKNRDQLPEKVKRNFKAAAGFGLLSIVSAAVNLAYIPAQVNTVNIATSPLFNGFAIAQLLFMVFCAWRLMLAVRNLF